MRTYYEEVQRETFEGFEIVFSAAPEDSAPDWDFESPEDEQQVRDNIDTGAYMWFVAKVECKKLGIVLATDYLGGCYYETLEDFVTANDYYADMRATVIELAKATIHKLAFEGITQ